jgi:hypothetical protein
MSGQRGRVRGGGGGGRQNGGHDRARGGGQHGSRGMWRGPQNND